LFSSRVGGPAGRRRRVRIASVALLAVAFTAFAAAAATAGDDEGTPSQRFEHIDPATVGRLSDSTGNWLPASMSNKIVSVMVELPGDPVAVVEADARKNGQTLSDADRAAIRANLKSKQDAISGGIASSGASVIGKAQDAYNGILVHAPESALASIAALPGVTGIDRVGLQSVPDNVNGVQLIQAPTAWGSSSNLTGKGVKVAVIDTGVDYTHADFGGPGTAAAWNAAKANSTGPADPSLFGPTAPKVKGGYDFSGDAYDAGIAGSTPQPDSNPLDCNGHGTHTSGTATGFGVLSTGATYTGTYGASTITGNGWKVGPGVAPKADLYMYRIFGCEGSSDLAILAINRAVADGVDVISMSLGSPFGGSDQTDPEAVAVNNAVAAGVTVVASAGNSGQNAYLVGAPSTANRALSVAASDGSVPTYPAASFSLSTGGSLTAINANGATFANGLTAPVKVLRDATGGVSLGCTPSEYVNQGAAGKIVVVQRGTCARVARAIFGQQAGAVAVVMINNSPALPPFEGAITSNPDTGEQYTVTIPFLGVKGCAQASTCPVSADAAALIAADGGTATLTNSTTPNTSYKQSASFTSGGPRQGDSAAKPEITAPGVSVTSALVGGGTAGTVMSGTSMACPMTSGTAALVVQAHPTWTADQIKAALVNTADPSLIIGYNGRINGSGFLQAQKATDTVAVATTADGLDSLSYGYVPGTSDYTATKSFTITNTGSSQIKYDLSLTQPLGASISANPSSFSVSPGASQNVDVTLTITSAQFAALPSASSFSTGVGQVVTRRGAVTAVPKKSGAGLQSLRMPLLVAPRGLSSVTAGALAPYARQGSSSTYTTSVSVSNAGIHSGTADIYAWGIHDANDLGSAAQDVRDVGVQSFGDGTVVFAVNSYNQASTAATQEYDIAIDTQNDGKVDYYVVGVDLGAVLTGTFDGRFGSVTIDARTGALVDAFFADAPMNSSTVLLPTTLADLGLHAGNTSFYYAVNGFSVFGGNVDTTKTASFDAANSGVSNGQFAQVPAGGSASLSLSADTAKLQSSPALGWLSVNVDDAGGAAQADEIPLGTVK
jgi:minor extracellular serine protease Vpr